MPEINPTVQETPADYFTVQIKPGRTVKVRKDAVTAYGSRVIDYESTTETQFLVTGMSNWIICTMPVGDFEAALQAAS